MNGLSAVKLFCFLRFHLPEIYFLYISGVVGDIIAHIGDIWLRHPACSDYFIYLIRVAWLTLKRQKHALPVIFFELPFQRIKGIGIICFFHTYLTASFCRDNKINAPFDSSKRYQTGIYVLDCRYVSFIFGKFRKSDECWYRKRQICRVLR